MGRKHSVVPVERIESQILLIRGHKVMLDADLAALYGASVGRLNEAVRRNRNRFPGDFMFQLTKEELINLRHRLETSNLKSQFAISSSGWGGRRHPPYAFTEQGVAMLSSVLKSKRAVQVNIEIMRAFVRLRQIISSHKELTQKLAELERRIGTHGEQIQVIFEAIRRLMTPPETKRRKIGFLVSERAARYGKKRQNGETVSLSTNQRFLAIIERSRSRVKREGSISAKEMRRRLRLD
jgi:hypothetical protein